MLVCLGVLWFGLRRASAKPAAPGDDAAKSFFRSQLAGIDADVASGRMSEDEAEAARAELAREVIRHEKEAKRTARPTRGRLAVIGALPVVAVASLALYGVIGRADLPAMPLAEREREAELGQMSIEDAVERVEAQLAQTPDDVRGWMVLAPFYMEQERYADAANAWRRVLDLEPPTAARQTSLAEALTMANDGVPTPEAMELLHTAAAADPANVRARFYLADEYMRRESFEEAATLWQELLALSTGEEAWVQTAREGLVVAQAQMEGAGLAEGEPDATMGVMIRGMVESLAARLYDKGGSAEEWMQLVRSRQQLDGDEAARADLGRGLDALNGQDRTALEAFGQDLDLTMEQ